MSKQAKKVKRIRAQILEDLNALAHPLVVGMRIDERDKKGRALRLIASEIGALHGYKILRSIRVAK